MAATSSIYSPTDIGIVYMISIAWFICGDFRILKIGPAALGRFSEASIHNLSAHASVPHHQFQLDSLLSPRNIPKPWLPSIPTMPRISSRCVLCTKYPTIYWSQRWRVVDWEAVRMPGSCGRNFKLIERVSRFAVKAVEQAQVNYIRYIERLRIWYFPKKTYWNLLEKVNPKDLKLTKYVLWVVGAYIVETILADWMTRSMSTRCKHSLSSQRMIIKSWLSWMRIGWRAKTGKRDGVFLLNRESSLPASFWLINNILSQLQGKGERLQLWIAHPHKCRGRIWGKEHDFW